MLKKTKIRDVLAVSSCRQKFWLFVENSYMVSCFSVSQDCKHVHYIGLLLPIMDGNFKKSSLEMIQVIFPVSEKRVRLTIERQATTIHDIMCIL